MYGIGGDEGERAGRSASLGERLRLLDRHRRVLEAEIVAVVGQADRSGEFRADGHTTVAGWCRSLVSCSTEQAQSWRRTARLNDVVPAVDAALGCAELGVEQAHLLGRAFANPRCGHRLGEVVPTLLEHARNLSFHEFRLVVRRWELLADTDGAHRDADKAHAGRAAWLTESGGVWRFGGSCGPTQGAVLAEVWERFAEAEWITDWAAARAEHGAAVTPEHLPRSGQQRRLDSLVELATLAATTPVGSQRAIPLVNLVVDLATVEQLMTSTSTATAGVADDPRQRRCETMDGADVPARDVLAAMLVGQVRRVVVDGAGVVVDVGRRRRLFNGAARDAVLLGSSRCCWAGCERPASRCQADHLVEWRDRGPTDVANGGPLCRWHNVFKSANGFRSWRDRAGSWHTFRPDGTELTEPRAA